MQYSLLEFFGSCQDKGNTPDKNNLGLFCPTADMSVIIAGSTTYGPFVKLPPVCQELSICCLYYLSHLDLPLLKSLSICCLCEYRVILLVVVVFCFLV